MDKKKVEINMRPLSPVKSVPMWTRQHSECNYIYITVGQSSLTISTHILLFPVTILLFSVLADFWIF